MPGLPAAQAQVEAYGKTLEGDLKIKMEAYNAQLAAYQAGEAGFTEAQRNLKREEIVAAEGEIQKFQQNGTQLINLKRDEALAPLYQKIGDVLDRLAKAGGYSQVMQINNNIVFIDKDHDLTIPVLKGLGITVKEN
jgi:outer membrane protein